MFRINVSKIDGELLTRSKELLFPKNINLVLKCLGSGYMPLEFLGQH
jgi:hypothetical protein